MSYCNLCNNAGWRGITEKDVYGQEPVGHTEFKGYVSRAFTNSKPNTTMKPILLIIRCTAVVIAGIAIITLAAKIVVTGVTFLWNLW